MKKLLALTLATLMALTALIIVPASAEIGGYTELITMPVVKTSGDWSYYVEGGAATITGYTGSATAVTIPDKIDGYVVTSISEWAFYGHRSLTGVNIPDSVTTIGEAAFLYCTSLTGVTIPNSVTEIGWYAFGCCDSLTEIDVDPNNENFASVDGILFTKDKTTLIVCPGGKTSVTIPEGVTTIGEFAFIYCPSLTSVTIPDGVTELRYGSFGYCTALTDVTLPDGLTVIAERAFSNSTALTSITIPDSVTTIGKWAFSECDSLKTVYYGGSEKQWYTVNIDNTENGNGPLLNANIVFAVDDPLAKGDANGDGKINSKDVIAIMKAIVGAAPARFSKIAADFDESGKVNSKDVIAIMKAIVK